MSPIKVINVIFKFRSYLKVFPYEWYNTSARFQKMTTFLLLCIWGKTAHFLSFPAFFSSMEISVDIGFPKLGELVRVFFNVSEDPWQDWVQSNFRSNSVSLLRISEKFLTNRQNNEHKPRKLHTSLTFFWVSQMVTDSNLAGSLDRLALIPFSRI